MKMKLSLIVVAMIAATWLAVGDSPRVRSMEQRVSELEQIVVAQQSQIEALQAPSCAGISERVTAIETLITPFFEKVYVDYTGYINVRVPVCFEADFIFAHNIYYSDLTWYY